MLTTTIESIVARCIRAKNGCLEWQGSYTQNGYPRMSLRGLENRGNRVIWTLYNGSIKNGLFVLHECDNKKCLEISHLKLGTNFDNMQDAIKRNRNPFKNKTHCKRGHPFNDKNTRINKNGSRHCRRCYNLYDKIRADKNRSMK